MLARKQSLLGKAGAKDTTATFGSPVWSRKPGSESLESTRHLLIFGAHAIDGEIAGNLRRADWTLHFAGNAVEASSLIARFDILVGLCLVGPEDTNQHSDELRDILARFRQVRWIGAFPPDQMAEEPVTNLVAEYLCDYVYLPLDSSRLEILLGHAQRMAVIANRHFESRRHERATRFGMVGSSPPMQALFHAIERAGRCDLPVVIAGETGTGKETTARAIHASSIRRGSRFVTLSCAAISTQRLQHELDAFSTRTPVAMDEDQRDHIKATEGGTLFLDEVSDLSPEAQGTLLRFLVREGRFHPDTTKPNWRKVRLICATNKDLEKLAQDDQFRMDLTYRLRALAIEVPSLRKRQSDTRILAQHFLEEIRQHDNSLATGFSADALTAIERYEWPGNVRELRNRIHQAALCCPAAFITPDDLRLAHEVHEEPALSLQEARDVAEKQTIWLALQRNRQNLSRAARELHVSRMTLYRLLSKHQINRGD